MLYIFWRSGPCLRYHWQICFPIRWFFFQFNALFFSNAEAFYFVKVPFVYSFLYVPCFRDITGHGDVHSHVSVKMLLRGMSEIFLPMFSSRTFMVLRLIFKFFVHLEFTFAYSISW